MKIDLTKLPVGEAVIGFLVIATIVTFALAFSQVDGDVEGGAEETVTEAPTATPGDGETPPQGGNEIAVSMGDNFFDPEEISVAAGADLTFAITNDGSAIHNMRVAGADNEYDSDDDAVSDPDIVTSGDSATLTWTAPDSAGVIDFRCDFHPTDMVGKIIVE
jgi:plastocyanin